MAHEKRDTLRYNPDVATGLTSEQVNQRVSDKLTNFTTKTVGKTYIQIIFDNVLNFFNILLFVIAGFIIAAKKYDSLFFLIIVILNSGIGLYEDIHARRLMDKLSIVTQPKAYARRDGNVTEIPAKDVVLDDILIIKSGNQIVADCKILSGNLLVNESLLTGESMIINKTVGDILYSGSFVVSGNAEVIADKVGDDTYVQSLQASAKKFKRAPSQILKSLKVLFRYLGIAIVFLSVVMIVIYGVQGYFSSYREFQTIMGSISGSLVSMIPSGLYLLTSVALATAVIKLSKEKARVQDFYSVEMLARTNILCVDKTGTITNGSMTVHKIISYGAVGEVTITGIMSDFVNCSHDENATMLALKDYFKNPSKIKAKEVLDFNSDNKYSAVTFESGITYVLGAAEYINLGKNKSGVLHRIGEYTSKGYRVLVLAKTSTGIVHNKVAGECEAIGMIVLQDHIRPDAIKTFAWFKENNVEIKVISGDDAQTVSEIAKQAGIDGADKYISLAGMSIEEVKEIASHYNVFGRVTPEQKEAIIMSLKKDGNNVAMTGDGVNDILALKRADCSIAMASGSEAAKNVSHIVLLDSNFDHLPSVVGQGRRVINNLQRTASLFLTKTFFAITLTVVFLTAGLFRKELKFPFETNNLYIWEIACIGAASFFLALEPNAERLKGSFLGNIFRKSIPAAIATVSSVLIIFILYIMQNHNAIYVGIYSIDAVVVMCTIAFTTISVAVLLKICLPFTKYRAIVFSGCASIAVIGFVLSAILSIYVDEKFNIFHLKFSEMNAINYLVTGIVTISIITFYLAISYIVEVLKGEKNNAQN